MRFFSFACLVFLLVLCLSAPAAQAAARATPQKVVPPVTLTVPEQCHDGDPFMVAVSSPGMKRAVFTWQGKKMSLEPGKNGQPENRCEAIFAVPLDTKAKNIPLKVTVTTGSGSTESTAVVEVVKKDYPVQRLQVEQKYVTPPKSVQERIASDRKQMSAALRRVSPVRHWDLPFKRPSPGEITSLFGLRRVFNGQERNPHRGLDFDALEGDPVQACDTGVVALVGDFYYNGNTVVLDHGLGVLTYYLHLSRIDVAEGQKVARGEVVGLIGSTGRVTGPHLHLGLSVMGKSVNAAPFIEGLKELGHGQEKNTGL